NIHIMYIMNHTFICRYCFIIVTANPEIYSLSLHDALPICRGGDQPLLPRGGSTHRPVCRPLPRPRHPLDRGRSPWGAFRLSPFRSEEHTSELQSRENLVCRLLLEKTK